MHPDHGKGLTFSEALEQLKDGRKLQRQSWLDKGQDQWVVRQVGYPQGITLNPGTAQATGLPEGSIQVFEPYFMMYTPWSTFVQWTPSAADLNADDWAIYYMPGEYERLCQEETDAILADPATAADLEEAGLDPTTFSHEEVKMVVALRTLERKNLADKEAIRFRLVRQLLRPAVGDLSQVDLTDPVRDDGANALPQVSAVIHAFVTIITKLNEDLTVAKLDLDATKERLTGLEKFEEIWDTKYPVSEGFTSNDAIRAYQRIRYFQDGWKDSPGFTEATWRLIATLMDPLADADDTARLSEMLKPTLAQWRKDLGDQIDSSNWEIRLSGTTTEGVDKVLTSELRLPDPESLEERAQILQGLEERRAKRLADPEATQRIRVRPLRPGDEARPERPQRLADEFRLRATFGPSEIGEEDPPVGPRKLRPSFPGETEPAGEADPQ